MNEALSAKRPKCFFHACAAALFAGSVPGGVDVLSVEWDESLVGCCYHIEWRFPNEKRVTPFDVTR